MPESVVFKRPKLSLSIDTSPQPQPEPVSIVDYLRQNFNILNDLYFQETRNQDIHQSMTAIMEKCLRSFGQPHNCHDKPVKLKIDNKVVDNNFFIGYNYYKSQITGVHVYSCDNYVYKITSFLNNNVNGFFKLVLEICLQKYAHSLNCGMKIPKINDYTLSQNDYTLSQNDDKLSLEIQMEKIEILDVSKEDIKQELLANYAHFIEIIKAGLDCFERNGLYHNDTHSGNIGFYKDDGGNIQVVFMDFGKATMSKNNRYPSPSGFYKQLNDREKFNEWLSHKIHVNTGSQTFYGGKKRRTHKNKKQRKQRRRKTHCRK
jgi:hypothetical protein